MMMAVASGWRDGAARMVQSASFRTYSAAMLALLLFAYSLTLVHEMLYLAEQHAAARAVYRAAAHIVAGGAWRDDDVHFVFSSSCSTYMNWQSLLLAHSFRRVQQHGRLTRILSGCSDAAVAEVRHVTARHAPHLRLHVTDSFSTQPVPGIAPDDYDPYNKPFGLRHWLRHAEPAVNESLVVFIDPDFLFNRRFVVNARLPVVAPTDYSAHKTPPRPYLVYSGKRGIQDVVDHVHDGMALGQRWSDYLSTEWFAFRHDNTTPLCAECTNVTKAYAREYLYVGPPYVLTLHDARAFADDYANMTVQVRSRARDDWMAEMHGYMLGAAKQGIRHTTLDNLALGRKDDDYSGFVDYLDENPCDPATPTPIASPEVPLTMHGCHTVWANDSTATDWRYYKRLVPDDLFTCEAWLLALPPPDIWTVAQSEKDKQLRQQRMMHVYGLCTWIKALNLALVDFKRAACTNGTANLRQRLKLLEPRPRATIASDPNATDWLVDDSVEMDLRSPR